MDSEDSLTDDALSLIDSTGEEIRLLERPQNRDRDVYLFYFQNVGWLLISLYLILAIAFMVALNFPRQYPSTISVHFELHANYSLQKSGLSGGQKPMRIMRMSDWATG